MRILQGYAAYTIELDRFNASLYGGRSGPSYVVFDFKDIDLRHPMVGAPATVRELLRNYELVEGEPRHERLLLRRTAPRFGDTFTTVENVQAYAGDWVEVPFSDQLLFAELDMKLTLSGKLREALFRVPPVAMEVEYAGGRRVAHRFIPATAGNGLLMNFLPNSVDDLAGLFLESAGDRVVRFRIGGSGALLYEPQYGISWKQVDSTIRIRDGKTPELALVDRALRAP